MLKWIVNINLFEAIEWAAGIVFLICGFAVVHSINRRSRKGK